ncbi:MAG: phospholipase D family protein [Puniceicoccales bacterium]
MSRTWDSPNETALGQFFEAPEEVPEGSTGVYLLSDSREAFRARYVLASEAERTIDLQYYLWKEDTTGRLLLNRVLEEADRGVRVRILIDDIYHKGRDEFYADIDAHPNVEIRVFNPVANRGLLRNFGFVAGMNRYNHRMHNKIFLVDGAVGILGGRNIGDDYFAIDPQLNFDDMDALVVGEAAGQAGDAFDLFWNAEAAVPIDSFIDYSATEASHRAMRTKLLATLEGLLKEVPYHIPADQESIQAGMENVRNHLVWTEAEVVVDVPERYAEKAESAIFELLAEIHPGIKEEIYLQSAYFLPEAETVEAFGELVENGVEVHVMTNSLMSNNHVSVHGHYAKTRPPMLKAGVNLYELRADGSMMDYYRNRDSRLAGSNSGLHTKAFVIDRRISVIGSYNMDPRSRVWNSEIALVVYDPIIGAQLQKIMEEEMAPENAYRVSFDESGNLQWTAEFDGEEVIFTSEPNATRKKRTISKVSGWIPVRGQL